MTDPTNQPSSDAAKTSPPPSSTPPVTMPPVADPMAPATQGTSPKPILSPEASLGQRIAAYLLDFGVAIAIYIAFAIIATIFSWILGDFIGGIFGLLGSMAGLGYLLFRDSLPFLEGQSIGKKVTKTKAVTESGESLVTNLSSGLVRNAVLFIPFFSLVELVVLLTGKDKPGGLRRLGDRWAKTKVVKV